MSKSFASSLNSVKDERKYGKIYITLFLVNTMLSKFGRDFTNSELIVEILLLINISVLIHLRRGRDGRSLISLFVKSIHPN